MPSAAERPVPPLIAAGDLVAAAFFLRSVCLPHSGRRNALGKDRLLTSVIDGAANLMAYVYSRLPEAPGKTGVHQTRSMVSIGLWSV